MSDSVDNSVNSVHKPGELRPEELQPCPVCGAVAGWRVRSTYRAKDGSQKIRYLACRSCGAHARQAVKIA